MCLSNIRILKERNCQEESTKVSVTYADYIQIYNKYQDLSMKAVLYLSEYGFFTGSPEVSFRNVLYNSKGAYVFLESSGCHEEDKQEYGFLLPPDVLEGKSELTYYLDTILREKQDKEWFCLDQASRERILFEYDRISNVETDYTLSVKKFLINRYGEHNFKR